MTLKQDIEIYENKKRELTAKMIDEVADRAIIKHLKEKFAYHIPSNLDDLYFSIQGIISAMLYELFYADEEPHFALDYQPKED